MPSGTGAASKSRLARLKAGYPLATGDTPAAPPATRRKPLIGKGGEVVRGSGAQMATRQSTEKSLGLDRRKGYKGD